MNQKDESFSHKRSETLIVKKDGVVQLTVVPENKNGINAHTQTKTKETFSPADALKGVKDFIPTPALLALGIILLLITAFSIWVMSTDSPIFSRDVILGTSLVLACGFMVFARAILNSKDQWAWFFIGSAIVAWAVADILYYYRYGLVSIPTETTLTSGIISGLSYMLMYIGVIFLVKNRISVNDEHFVLNVLMSTFTALAFLTTFVLSLANGSVEQLSSTTGAMINVIFAMLLVSLVFAIIDTNHYKVSSMWWLLFLGFVFLWYADISFYLSSAYFFGSWMDIVWVSAFFVLTLASWLTPAKVFLSPKPLSSLLSPSITITLTFLLLLYGNYREVPAVAILFACLASSLGVIRIYQVGTEIFIAEKMYTATFNDTKMGCVNNLYMTAWFDTFDEKQKLNSTKNNSFALIIIEVANLKEVTETFGVSVGDKLLKKVLVLLKETFSANEFVAYLGDGKFAVGVFTETPRDSSHQWFKVLRNELNHTTLQHEGVVFIPKLYGGVSAWPSDATTVKELPHKASSALEVALKLKKDTPYVFYDSGLESRNVGKFLVEQLFRDAVKGDELVCHYQPKLDLATGLVTEVESLIRWNRPGGLSTPPSVLLPAVKDAGLEFELFEKVVDIVLSETVKWRNLGMPIRPSVNVSLTEIKNEKFVDFIRRQCDLYELPYSCLTLEVVEYDEEQFVSGNLLKTFNELTKLGFTFSLDDFGEGKSGFDRVKLLPFREVKIDKSLVQGVGEDIFKFQALKNIVESLHSYGVLVVAEGIEEMEDFKQVVAVGCDYVQGYYISPPLPTKELTTFVQKFNPQSVTRQNTDIRSGDVKNHSKGDT